MNPTLNVLLIERNAMRLRIFEAYKLSEWKLIYLVLLQTMTTRPELIDVQFFNDLQTHLQRSAEDNNINPLNHEEWFEWLND